MALARQIPLLSLEVVGLVAAFFSRSACYAHGHVGHDVMTHKVTGLSMKLSNDRVVRTDLCFRGGHALAGSRRSRELPE